MSEPRNDFTDGAAYENYMGRWSKLVGRQFLAWLNPPPGSSWLDVGCGNGAFTDEVIARANPRAVTGIDPSPEQIEYARSRHGAAQATYHVGDAQSLPFADGSFNVTTMALVIAFVPNPQKGIAEMCRVTKPGGQVAAYMWDLPKGLPGAPIIDVLTAMGLPYPLPQSAAFSQMDPLLKLWGEAGLKHVESKRINISVSFADFDEFKAWSLLPSGPLTKALFKLEGPAREELYARLRQSLPKAKDSSIIYESFANAIKGLRA